MIRLAWAALGVVDGGQGYGVLVTAANGLVPRRGS